MKVAGRITLFGEAYGGLRPKATASVPTTQAVFTGDDVALRRGRNTYVQEEDVVGRTLISLGAIEQMASPMESDLPIEFGLASSTALALAHLGRWVGAEVEESVSQTDGGANGFHPSGADFAAISNKEAGVFGLGVWTPLDIRLPSGSHLILPEKEREFDKLRPTLAMRSAAEHLGPLIDRLVVELEASAELDLDALLEYSRCLFDLDVYSKVQRGIIGPLLERGVVAKGVGAMYDRAILVLADAAIWEASPPGEVLDQDG